MRKITRHTIKPDSSIAALEQKIEQLCSYFVELQQRETNWDVAGSFPLPRANLSALMDCYQQLQQYWSEQIAQRMYRGALQVLPAARIYVAAQRAIAAMQGEEPQCLAFDAAISEAAALTKRRDYARALDVLAHAEEGVDTATIGAGFLRVVKQPFWADRRLQLAVSYLAVAAFSVGAFAFAQSAGLVNTVLGRVAPGATPTMAITTPVAAMAATAVTPTTAPAAVSPTTAPAAVSPTALSTTAPTAAPAEPEVLGFAPLEVFSHTLKLTTFTMTTTAPLSKTTPISLRTTDGNVVRLDLVISNTESVTTSLGLKEQLVFKRPISYEHPLTLTLFLNETATHTIVKISTQKKTMQGITEENKNALLADFYDQQGTPLSARVWLEPEQKTKLPGGASGGGLTLLANGDQVEILDERADHYLIRIVTNFDQTSDPDVAGRIGWVKKKYVDGP